MVQVGFIAPQPLSPNIVVVVRICFPSVFAGALVLDKILIPYIVLHSSFLFRISLSIQVTCESPVTLVRGSGTSAGWQWDIALC